MRYLEYNSIIELFIYLNLFNIIIFLESIILYINYCYIFINYLFYLKNDCKINFLSIFKVLLHFDSQPI